MATAVLPRTIGTTSVVLSRRFTTWVAVHRLSLMYVSPILLVGSLIRVWNFTSTPGAWNDDEGTYVSQAWAILNDDQLAHYTYWYDHPPFGWMQVAGWAWLTDAFGRNSAAIMVGRELVAVYTIISSVLLYVLCRRLGMLRISSAIGMVLFMLSPLSLNYGRMMFLDSVAIPWILAAMLCALHSNRSHYAALWAAFFLAGASLTKETMLVFAPVIVLLIWQRSPRTLRLKNVVTSVALTIGVGSFYMLLAILKGELFVGKGHVSLEYAVRWQLFDREGGGSVFDAASLNHGTLTSWLDNDPYLLIAALAVLVVLLVRRAMWPIALTAIIHILLLLRSGYLPIGYVVILVPIAALVIAGAIDTLWRGWNRHNVSTYVMRGVCIAGVVCFVAVASHAWYDKTITAMTGDDMSNEQQAVAWIEKNVPASEHAQIVTDDNIWPDLMVRGYERDTVDWFYKLDVDSAVTPRYTPKNGNESDSWKSVDYIVIPPLGTGVTSTRPTLQGAIDHAKVVAQFFDGNSGYYLIYKVQHE
jgi:hypothetical protein